ncbi:MAG: acyl-CoA dehydrogenase family protein [Alphaproteobacteria bacterium]
MDVLLSDDIRALRESFIKFMRAEIVPEMPAYEKAAKFPHPLVRKAGEAGFYGALFPEALGGSDLGFLATAVICEEIARLEPDFALTFNQQGMSCPYSILIGGTKEQCQTYIPNLIGGKAIGLWSLTESGGSSDAAGNMKTLAVRDGNVYRLKGAKMFASLADATDTGVLFAKTDMAAGAKGITAFLVEPKKYPGWTAKPIEFVGLSRSIHACEVYLDDFVVPVENRLGDEGEGFRIAMHSVQAGRIAVGARAIGYARACIDLAIDYAKSRMVRGSPLATYQMVQADVADVVTQIEAARGFVYTAAMSMDRDLPSNRLASQAKYAAGLALNTAAKKSAEIFGGYALAREYPISRLQSYAYLYQVGEGSPNVQRILIAEDALGIKNADRHPTRYRRPNTWF